MRKQNFNGDEYEIIVVDDGSTPPLTLSFENSKPSLQILRLENVERSAARNAGAEKASGKILIFLDNDMKVDDSFVSSHFKAHSEWTNAIGIGRIHLEKSFNQTPFGRFRQQLETIGVPLKRGVVESKNLCAAGNMSIPRERFLSILFDPLIVSGEDQDFALNHTSQGGQIVYLPEAESIHCDNALDIQSYCKRFEWGSEFMLKFCRKHPEWIDNIERERVNGFIRLGKEPLKLSISKFIKSILSLKPFLSLMSLLVSIFERLVPNSYFLTRLYSMLLGIHIFRGYRKGLKKLLAREV